MGMAQASDVKRETDVSDAIAKTLNFGKLVWLEAGATKFLSLYAETEKATNKGTVILLHDLSGHPDQQSVIYQLRRLLPTHNWATLSLQMPLRELGAGPEEYYPLFPEALACIQAGVKYAQDNGAKNIVLVGYGLGALQAVYAQSEQPTDIKALVAISLPVPVSDNKTAQTLVLIKNIKVPMLDVYGGLDLSDVTNSARDRRLATKENTAYRQLLIDDEGHQYLHDEGLLGKRIVSWLAKVVTN
jgi:pimeloyl-ACP methyl ester carboxylesterase